MENYNQHKMTFDILKNAQKDVYLIGNIGYPSIEVAYNHPNALIVTEVSSFQLQGTKYFIHQLQLLQI